MTKTVLLLTYNKLFGHAWDYDIRQTSFYFSILDLFTDNT